MEQDHKNNDLLTPDHPVNLKSLYAQYAGKLLGYILPIVNNRELAEECVVKVFAYISTSKTGLPASNYSNTWSWLTKLANNQIQPLSEATGECKSVINNTTYIQGHKYLNRMNEAQRRVFCGVYYHRKTTAELANELHLPEQELRHTLKEAFMIIRKVKDAY
ncbi:RNA polymerase sigma factor [Mucilaginibacter calamicampi]|uniref:RNA polymerase sigma factor n=1 Tax=Mucilaginibacter calamicampi TaxID=1302352 RepID=A0ABW2Z1V0_9SPHI